jgi:hypothetical protein
MLYRRVRDILKVFESLKELISEELLKIETYVKRAKEYLREDNDKLRRNLEIMMNYMKKIKKTRVNSIKNDYMKKFNDIHAQTQETIDSYKKLKLWLIATLSSFKQLF